MKRYLAWNRSEQVCPAIASSPPPSAFAAVPFSLNGITSCPSSATANNQTNLFTTSTDTSQSNLFAAAFSAATIPSDTNFKINSANIFLDQNKTLLGPDNNSLGPNSPQVTTTTTSAFNRHQPQLSAAAAEYLLAAAFGTNTSQLACPSTSYPQPLTPLQQPQTPQQQLDSFFVQYNHEQNLQRQQNAATTAALVAALQQQRQQQQQQQQQQQLNNQEIQSKNVTDNHNNSADQQQQQYVNSNGNSVDLFANAAAAAAAAAAVQTSTLDQNNAASIVAQFSSSTIPCGNVIDGGRPLANNLANVCAAAAAAAAAASVTVNAQPPPSSIENVGPSSVLSTTSTSIVQPNGKSSSTPIILNSLTSNSSLSCGSSSIDSSTTPNNNNNNNSINNNLTASTRSAFLSPQHSSAFQLVSPLSQQSQNSPNISGINFLQQHHLQNQNLSSLNNPQEAIHSTTSAAAAAAIQQQQAFTLASNLSASLPLPPPAPSSSSTLSSLSSTTSSLSQQQQHRQQAVPAGLSQHTQSQTAATTNEIHPSPMNQAAAAAAAALYPQLMCLPAFLDHLGPHILRSHMNSTQLKPIPNNEKVDLARFRVKEPQEWVMDDVLAWMLDVARRNQVPVENINMHKFATCNGPRLLLMNEQAFLERDPVYGTMLFTEFRKLVGEDNVIDDWMRSCKEEEDSRPSTSRGLSFDIKPPSSQSSSSSHSQSHLHPQHQQHQQQQQQHQHHFNGFLGVHSPISPLIQNSLSQQHAAAAAAAVAAATSQQFLKPPTNSLNNLHRGPPQLSAAQIVAAAQNSLSNGGGGNTSYDPRGDQSFHGVNSLRIKKNKDGRPRKRSQHTKGNKLWEFIRDALKDPCTCPSIVRWEDPVEGVFRIVESEKLARLWGEKKNNQKMTYEKLSRAMRTYYEKQILVPVPKTGLYPKKLVYKFGPGANGVSAPPQMIAASNAASRMEPMDMA
jgi:ETS factor family protein